MGLHDVRVPAITVLVTDAQRLFADALGSALGQCEGLRVLEHRPTDAVEAIAVVTREHPDVALIDYWLPDMEGPVSTASVLARRPDTKVLVLSWFHGPQQITAALEAGAVGFLPKSLTVAVVAEGVRRAVAGECPVFGEQLGRLAETITARNSSVDQWARRYATLTARELEVLRLLAAGLPADDIADRLEIAETTTRTHIHKILAKTEAHSQLEAVAMARDLGLVP